MRIDYGIENLNEVDYIFSGIMLSLVFFCEILLFFFFGNLLKVLRIRLFIFFLFLYVIEKVMEVSVKYVWVFI